MRWLAEIIQNQWIGSIKLQNIESYHNIYKVKKNFLSLDFLDAYLPTQPSLLFASTLLCLLSVSLFVAFLIYCIAKRLGVCGGSYLNQTNKNPRKGFWPFMGACLGFSLCWIVLMLATLTMAACLLDFGSKALGVMGIDEDSEINGNLQGIEGNRMLSSDQHVFVGLNTVSIQDKAHSQRLSPETTHRSAENHLLNKFNDLRELGYEFKPLERDSSTFVKNLVFLLILVFYVVTLIIAGLAALVGMREQLQTYQHSVDIFTSSHSDRSGRTLATISLLMFALSPLVNFLATSLLVYSHAHSLICPFEQTLSQNSNIEDYVNENYGSFEPLSLVDFLGDLSKERVAVNQANCQEYICPLQGIWACLLLLAWVSLPAAFFCVKLSKHLLKRSANKMVSSWSPDTYSTIVGEQQKSAGFTFGTFVYQKY